jgi:hypothetical protein
MGDYTLVFESASFCLLNDDPRRTSSCRTGVLVRKGKFVKLTVLATLRERECFRNDSKLLGYVRPVLERLLIFIISAKPLCKVSDLFADLKTRLLLLRFARSGTKMIRGLNSLLDFRFRVRLCQKR